MSRMFFRVSSLSVAPRSSRLPRFFTLCSFESASTRPNAHVDAREKRVSAWERGRKKGDCEGGNEAFESGGGSGGRKLDAALSFFSSLFLLLDILELLETHPMGFRDDMAASTWGRREVKRGGKGRGEVGWPRLKERGEPLGEGEKRKCKNRPSTKLRLQRLRPPFDLDFSIFCYTRTPATRR